MNSNENPTNNGEKNEKNNKTITKNNKVKEKDINIQNDQYFLSLFKNHNPNNKKFGLKKQKTDFKLKSNSTPKRKLPLLTYSSISFYDSLPSENAKGVGIEILKKKLISNKSNINKKKAELQDLKIQFNKLMKENKNHKNLIYEILKIDYEGDNSNRDNNAINNILYLGQVTEEELINKINSCNINNSQEKRLKDSYDIINLRTEINSKRKLLINKNSEYDTLKDNIKYKQMNEITVRLEQLIIDEKKIKLDIMKLEEILKKNNETLPTLEKECEKEEKNYEEIIKKENEYKNDFNNKLHKLGELRTDIQNIENKSKSKKILINKNTSSPEYKGTKTLSIKIKAKIDKMKYELLQIDNYKKEKRDELVKTVSERRAKVNEQKKKNAELETKINELTEKNQDLYMKSIEYDEEKKKLENRGKVSNKELKKISDLQFKLKEVKDSKQKLENECQEKENAFKNNENEQKEKNKEIINQLNDLKNNIQSMNGQISELSEKIKEMQNDIDKCTKDIETKKIEIQNFDNENNKRSKNEEELQNLKNNLINENENYKNENDKLKNDIKLIEEQIQKYIGANDKLQQIK